MSDSDAAEPGTVSRPDWVLPPWLRLPRLEAKLGCRLDELDWSTIQKLVDDGVEEDESLDFKATDYDAAAEDGERRAFEAPKDVAAFANASGGLIVIGIGEKAPGVAGGFSKQRPTEKTKRDLTTTLVDGLAPFVSDVQMGVIANPDLSGEGCLLILVPPSDSAPHAVTARSREQKKRDEHSMWWPVREGSRTRWLREPELAERYRARFADRGTVQRRVETVLKEGLEALDHSVGVWLAVASAPTRPAPRRMLTAALREEVKLVAAPEGHLDTPGTKFSSQASFGAGRVVLSNEYQTGTPSTDHHVEVHNDGAAFAALRIDQVVEPHIVQGKGYDAAQMRAVDVADVARWSASLLLLTAAYGVELGASGDFQVQVQLVCSNTSSLLPVGKPERRIEATVLTEPNDASLTRMVPNSRAVSDFRIIALTSSPVVVLSPQELLQVAAAVAHEVYAQFGQLPSEPIVEPDGRVNISGARSHRARPLLEWAHQHGLTR